LSATIDAPARPGVLERFSGTSARRLEHRALPLPLPLPLSLPRERRAHARIVERDGSATVERRDRRYRLTLASADAIAAEAAFGLGLASSATPHWAIALIVIPLLVVFASKAYGLYDRDDLLVRKTTLDEAPKLFQLATGYVLVVWMLSDVLLDETLGRPQAALLLAALFSLTLLGRRAARSLAQRFSAAERIMFIGGEASHDRLSEKLDDIGNAELVAHLSLEEAHRIIRRSTGSVGGLRQIAAEWDVHRVIVEPSDHGPDIFMDVVRAAKGVGVRVSLLPRVFDVVGHSVELDDLDGMTLLGLRRFGLGRSSEALKRGLDVAGAGLVLVLLTPVIAVLAAAIKLDSRGSVLFRQTRVGRDGRHFKICKFRTMGVDAEQQKAALRAMNETEGLFKIARDPRITRVGRLLRKTSLDELPQLFNVIRGDMSLVGPRPLVLDEDQLITGFDRRRLHLKPGMTGCWQIAGSARVPLSEMVKIDYRYVAGWSLWNDIKIMLRTVPYMLARRGM
jgi:exopolysaccharide biosynthesis polyprenyl glycosylphosphotransferase